MYDGSIREVCELNAIAQIDIIPEVLPWTSRATAARRPLFIHARNPHAPFLSWLGACCVK